MIAKETAPTFSVINGKLYRATSTARVEVLPTEAACVLNESLAALCAIAALSPHDYMSTARKLASDAIAKAAQS